MRIQKIVIKTVAYAILFALLTFLFIRNGQLELNGYIPYKEFNGNFEYNLYFDKTKEEVIDYINMITNTNYPIIWNTSTTEHIQGKANRITKHIYLYEKVNAKTLAWNYTHEILHFKLDSSCERYIQFETFKVLYNCDLDCYKQVALWQANEMKNNTKSYNCAWYINEYLKDKE